jgi:hypothetical protein
LSDDVSSVQSAPRVLATGTDEGVDAMGLESEEFLNRHTFRLRAPQ